MTLITTTSSEQLFTKQLRGHPSASTPVDYAFPMRLLIPQLLWASAIVHAVGNMLAIHRGCARGGRARKDAKATDALHFLKPPQLDERGAGQCRSLLLTRWSCEQ